VTNQPDATVDDLVKDATIIFRGSVQKVKAATLAEIEPTPETIVVKVDEVLHGSQAFRDYTGQAVTVQLTAGPVPAVGQNPIFYANSWLSGESLAVKGVARLDKAADTAASVARQKADKPLRDRLTAAQMVVSGKVTVVRPVPPAAVARAAADLQGGQTTRVTEHDPDWHEAVVQVARVEKGQLAAAANNTVTVVFPASKDVLWYQAPKFQQGQEGMFLLHKTPAIPEAAAIVKARSADLPETYAAPEPNDFLPNDQIEKARTLLRPR
jgi:hypothetical protein